MENETLRGRLGRLLHKSRRALRLYTSGHRIPGHRLPGTESELTEVQVEEWRRVNAELYKELAQVVEQTNVRQLAQDAFRLRDRLQEEFRNTETELHQKQKAALSLVESGDFIRASSVCRELSMLKARVQATQAAHHELQAVLRRTRLPAGADPIELSVERIIPEQKQASDRLPKEGHKVGGGRIIPLRRARSS